MYLVKVGLHSPSSNRTLLWLFMTYTRKPSPTWFRICSSGPILVYICIGSLLFSKQCNCVRKSGTKRLVQIQ